MKPDFPSLEALSAAACRLGCELAAVRAVAQVEAGTQGAFLDTDEPVILFERHLFSRLTSRKFDGRRVPAAPPQWSLVSSSKPGGYGPVSKQHQRLAFAATLDRNAALKSASWGLFQILGLNYESCGFETLQKFVNAMYRSVDDHLAAFVAFIEHDPRLLKAIRVKDWHSFAEIYNGPQQEKHDYEGRLAAAYEVFA